MLNCNQGRPWVYESLRTCFLYAAFTAADAVMYTQCRSHPATETIVVSIRSKPLEPGGQLSPLVDLFIFTPALSPPSPSRAS